MQDEAGGRDLEDEGTKEGSNLVRMVREKSRAWSHVKAARRRSQFLDDE